MLPTWRTKFSDNYNNITEDLAAILELIDFVAGQIRTNVYPVESASESALWDLM